MMNQDILDKKGLIISSNISPCDGHSSTTGLPKATLIMHRAEYMRIHP